MARDVYLRVLRHVTGARSALNTPVETWPEVGGVYAEIRPVGDSEGIAVDQEMSVGSAVFRVRDNALTAAVTAKDRLVVRGKTWKVTGNTPVHGTRRAYRDLSAVMRSDGDET
jgi:head-tail adaptor